MLIYSILSRLLDYPDQELYASLELMHRYIAEDSVLSDDEHKQLLAVLEGMVEKGLLQQQADYVQTFDMVPEHSLYLTHHSFGDSRERGPALVELAEHYKQSGWEAKEGELPDYLPLILEYISTLDEMQASVFLGETAKILDILAGNLEKAHSPYAKLIRIIENHGHLARSAA